METSDITFDPNEINSQMLNRPSFRCTECGDCCANTIVPLTADEAVAWDQGGGGTGISAHLMLWDDEVALQRTMPTDILEWWRERTSEARCGRIRVRVSIRLWAVISETCHNLQGRRCSIYDSRPLVCRAYPVEVNEPPSDTAVYPEAAVCPPEAWKASPSTVGGLQDGFLAKDAYQAAWKQDQAPLRHLRGLIGMVVGSIPSDAEIIQSLPHGEVAALVAEARRRVAAQTPEPSPWWRVALLDHELGASLHRSGAFVVSEAPTGTFVLPGVRWRSTGDVPQGIYKPRRRK